MSLAYTKDYPKIFSPRQMAVMGLLARVDDERPIAAKAKEVGVTRRTVFNWRKLPGWYESECLLWQWHWEHHHEQLRQRVKLQLQKLLGCSADPGDAREVALADTFYTKSPVPPPKKRRSRHR